MSGTKRLAFATCAWLLTGCFSIEVQLPGALRHDLVDEDLQARGRFTAELTHTYVPFGLGQVRDDEVAQALVREAQRRGVDGVQGLRFESYFGPGDILLSVFTLGVLRSRSFRISGEWVRIGKPALPGGPPVDPAVLSPGNPPMRGGPGASAGLSGDLHVDF